MKWRENQAPLASTLKKDFPEVEESTRFIGQGKMMFKNGDLRFYEEKVFFSDSTVFRIFTYPFIEGDPRTALDAPNPMVPTHSEAGKSFVKASRIDRHTPTTN